MNNEKLKQQIRDLAIAADGLATAMHLFYANVSTEILDDDIEAAEKEQSSSLGAMDAFVYAIKKLQEKIAESDNHVSALLVPRLTAMYRLYHDILDILADNTHHCGQDASCQVGDGNAVVNDIPDSIKSLEGMQVVKVCSPKCKDCPCGDGLREYPSGCDASSCVKVELVGGYTLCLSPLPNSIVTE